MAITAMKKVNTGSIPKDMPNKMPSFSLPIGLKVAAKVDGYLLHRAIVAKATLALPVIDRKLLSLISPLVGLLQFSMENI